MRAARSAILGRPPLGFGGSGGMWSLMRSHNASGKSGFAMNRSSVTNPCIAKLVRFEKGYY